MARGVCSKYWYLSSTSELIMCNTGWDHGVFVPMKLINPSANVPIVQLSVLASESSSFHNIRLLFSPTSGTPEFKHQNTEWSNAVTDAAMTNEEGARGTKFEDWRNWPHTYTMHPRGGAEHFLPLIVCAGAAGDDSRKKLCG
jgi:aromatic ring-opening dioxygenase catalytic subunit (LigB family)